MVKKNDLTDNNDNCRTVKYLKYSHVYSREGSMANTSIKMSKWTLSMRNTISKKMRHMKNINIYNANENGQFS